jgi:drug/metabolite transporter (DMT)-like permease
MPPPPSIAAAADEVPLVDRAPVLAAAAFPDKVFTGIGLIIASTIFFCAGDIAAKSMTETMSAVQVAWLRYLVFCGLVVSMAFAAHGRAALGTPRPGLQVLRGLAVVISSVFFMFGLGHLQVAEATAINFISPVFITALSIPLLGERVGLHRWAASGVGFIGVMIIVQPGSGAFQTAALYPIGAALVWAIAAIATRVMSTERPETTLAWSAIVGLVFLTPMVMFDWRSLGLWEVSLAILTGVLSTVGHWLLIRGYRHGPASVLAPYSYVQLLFASLFGLVVFGVLPGFATIIGGVVIAASGLYTAHRERVRHRTDAGAATALRT